MPNLVAIIQDNRVRRQVEQYLQELGMEDLRFATFESLSEFEDLYFKIRENEDAPGSDKTPTTSNPTVPATPDPTPPPVATTTSAPTTTPTPDASTLPAAPVSSAATSAPSSASAEPTSTASAPSADPPPSEEVEKDPRLFDKIHVMLYALDSIESKSSPWIDKTRQALKKFNLLSDVQEIRWVLMKYEDDGVSKLDLLHPSLDDIIYLPVDRLVFLQKMEIFLNLPKTVKPRFLFNQQVLQNIEISKITKLDRLSDVGIAVRNPVKLKPGLAAKFYLNLPGEKGRLELKGKVLKTETHPEIPDQFLVYFTFFNIHRTEVSAIRRMLAKAPRFQNLLSDDREKIRYNANNLFNTEEDNRIFGIAIIDSDEQNATNVAQQLRKDMDRLQIITESSFSLFLHRYLEEKASQAEKTPAKPTDETDFYRLPISLSVSASDLKCLSVDPGPANEDLFLGHPAQALFSAPDKWLSLMAEKETQLLVEESVQLALRGRMTTKLLSLSDVAGQPRAVNLKFTKGSSDEIVNVELSPAGFGDLAAKIKSSETQKTMDALIIDSTFVPEEPAAWIEGLRQRAMQRNLVKEPNQLKFFVLAEADAKLNQAWLDLPAILGMYPRPIDFRQLAFLLSEKLPNQNTLYRFKNLGWSEPNLSIHVSKGVRLEALSEFGATIVSNSPLVPGTVFYLRKTIYENAPNGCLAARVYLCEENFAEKGTYLIHATYFGINDAFLKYARTWIRENYAQQKSKGEGG